MEITKQHNSVLSESFGSINAYEAHEKECAKFKNEFESVMSDLSQITPNGCNIRGNFSSFCPHLQYVVFDALKKEDWPHSIAENSIYLRFSINFKVKTFEVDQCGHIWLSDADKSKSHLCMCSIKSAVKAVGGKWMRKNRFHDAKDIASKMAKFYNEVMANVTKATGGYPYKQMLVNIY